MSDLIFVGDENSSIVDDWMVGSGSASSSFDASKVIDAKGGLGFKGETKKTAHNDDKFAKNLDKSANKKGKREREEDQNRSYEPSHGMVEDMEESRTSLGGILGGGFVRKSIVKASKHKQAEEAKKVAELAKQNAAAVATVLEPPVSTNTNVNSFNNGGDVKVKRTKTRSKQKNIRRDNRSSEDKPESLQVGHWKYMGRPLTKETKSIMGIVKPAPVVPVPGAERTGGKKNRNQNKKTAALNGADSGGDQVSATTDSKPASVSTEKPVSSEGKPTKKAKTEAK